MPDEVARPTLSGNKRGNGALRPPDPFTESGCEEAGEGALDLVRLSKSVVGIGPRPSHIAAVPTAPHQMWIQPA